MEQKNECCIKHNPVTKIFCSELSKRLKYKTNSPCFVFTDTEKIYAVSCIQITKKCKELLSSPEFIQEDNAYDTFEQLFKSKIQHLTTMYTLDVMEKDENGNNVPKYFSIVVLEIPETKNEIETIESFCAMTKSAHLIILDYTTSLSKLEHLEKDLNGTIAESN